MSDRRILYARIHLASWAVWAVMWVVTFLLARGETQLVTDTPADYWQFGVLFVSCMTLGISASAAGLTAGQVRAKTFVLGSWAAMIGALLPAAWRLARGRDEPAPPVKMF